MPIAPLAGVRLHYLRLPRKGRTRHEMVLVHGLGATLGFWHPAIILHLSALAGVTAFDLRGHGRSSLPPRGYASEDMARDMDDLLDYLGIEKTVVLAHSFGGSVALRWAMRFPERVAGLILVDVRLRAFQPVQRLKDWDRWPRWRRWLDKAGIILDEDDPEGGYRLLVEMARLELERPAFARRMPKNLALFGKQAARRWLYLQDHTTIRRDFLRGDGIEKDDLARLHVPVLGLYGEHSPALSTGKALGRTIPFCRIRIVPGAGHFFPLTQPAKLIRACVRFMQNL